MKLTMKLLALFFGMLMLANVASAETPREQIKQMVEQLQKTPSDNALRERIIRLAQGLKPAPAVPEEARRHFVKAVTLQKDAQKPEDYDLPIQEYRQALLLAPWWSDAYFDLASALELKQKYWDAIQNMKLSILASPESPDARAAQDKVYALEAKAEKSAVPAMVSIPGRNYEMGKYLVTQGQWKAVMGNNPSYFSNCGNNCPVEQVSWNDAQEFIQKLNAKTGEQYRLPSEAEWEYACYGGSQTEYCGSNDINAVAWYDKNSGDTTHPAGRKQPNAFGLYDMSGNVSEWVDGCYNSDCRWRVLRGGSWGNSTGSLRAAYRDYGDYGYRGSSLRGFRVARTLP